MKLLSENRLIAHGTIAGTLLTGISLAVAAVAFVVNLRNDASASRLADVDHEARLRAVETMRSDLSAVKTDVSWIREYFDPERHTHTASTIKP